ncbi:hypothetical protein GCM10017600_83540 [Streptosporangium carneum]|uniref:Uncharacterized protein n=1 Tax=Streptosporangium carneum TaxID=47481 RepID=A0A9W6IA62_9ACTN|nr:hypothetical protein GCM10017600_83540 [Streptosporangium carneum]
MTTIDGVTSSNPGSHLRTRVTGVLPHKEYGASREARLRGARPAPPGGPCPTSLAGALGRLGQ